MAVISKLTFYGDDKRTNNGEPITNIKYENSFYHFAENTEVNGDNQVLCEDAVSEPIIDMLVSGSSIQRLLPNEYQEVEYLENSGTQRIDTGLIPTNSTSIDITYQSLRPTGTSQYILGARTNASTTVDYAINGSSSNTYWDVRFNGVASSVTNMNRTTDKYHSVVELNNGNGPWTLTNLDTSATNEMTLSGAVVNATANLFLFAYNDLDVNTHANLRIFACKIYESSVLVRDYIPCYRKSDNVAGLYDLMNNEFYTNSGTGNFVVGANYESSPHLERPIEIKSVGEKTKNLFDISKAENGTIGSETGANLGTDAYPNRCRSPYIYLNAGSYTISFKELISTGSYIHKYSSNNSDNWLGKINLTKSGSVSKFTLENSCFIRFTIQPIDTSGSLELNTNTLVNYLPQLEQGLTATDYEPYGYKIPINISGNNLANEETILKNKLIGNSANGVIIDSEAYNTMYTEVEEGQTYSFTGFVRADGSSLKGCYYDTNGNGLSAFEETTVTIPSGVKYVGRSFYNANIVKLNMLISTENIYLKEPLRMINEVADILDYKNKKVIRNVGSVIYDGSQSWSTYDSGNGYMETNGIFPDGKPVLCNMFVNSTTLVKTLAIRKNYANVYVYGVQDYYPTQAEWHTFLAENNMEVIGQLITPIEETIEVPEIQLFDGTVVFNVETIINPSNTKINYWKQISPSENNELSKFNLYMDSYTAGEGTYVTFSFKKGMTWGEFIESDYNTPYTLRNGEEGKIAIYADNFTLVSTDDEGVTILDEENMNKYLSGEAFSGLTASDVIIPNENYFSFYE